LTEGQIVNTNASFLSELLTDLGYKITLHQTVADDESQIIRGLEYCRISSDQIIVTGGLGPTSDDFTRNVISKWTGKKLVFEDASWQKIREILEKKSVPIALSNRSQCFYPEGSEVLINKLGTANGFMCEHLDCNIWVLPGPGHEIKSMWDSGLCQKFSDTLPAGKKRELLIWTCMGISEAELGELVDSHVGDAKIEVGYRAHNPLIDVKVWIEIEDSGVKQHWISVFNQVLEPWVVSRDGEDLAEIFLSKIPSDIHVDVHDLASGGLINHWLSEAIGRKNESKERDQFTLVSQWEKPIVAEDWIFDLLTISDPGSLTFAIAGISSGGKWAIGYRRGSEIKVDIHILELSPQRIRDRGPQYLKILAFIKWARMLEGDA